MTQILKHTDADGYTVEFVVENGHGVLVSRSDTGTEVSVYLSKDACHELAGVLGAWAER